MGKSEGGERLGGRQEASIPARAREITGISLFHAGPHEPRANIRRQSDAANLGRGYVACVSDANVFMPLMAALASEL